MKTKIAAIILAIVALTSLTLAVGSAYALGGMSMASNRPTQTSWVRINGVLTKWGTTDVRGLLSVQARTVLLTNADKNQFARASAVWTTNTTRAISAVRAKENFTYTFYSAKLLNASVSTFSSSTTNFFLNGTWNVATVKSKVTIITNTDNEIVSVHRESDSTVAKVYGELTVTDNWTKVKLQLTGYYPLTGSVTRSVTRNAMFNWYKVTDDVLGTTVTRADVNAVVQCYRSMPGWGNYDNKMDFNFNYKIDIADLATVAANL
jgi:hypothetical protein